LPLLTPEEKSQIRNQAYMMAVDEKRRYNIIELGAALKIIRKTLGDEWYFRAGRDLIPPDGSPPANYDFLLKKEPLPVLTGLLRGGRPENILRVIDFAYYLKRLWGVSNVKSKINTYVKKESKGVVSQEVFSKVYFELKVATFYRDNGFRVEFIPEHGTKTPDLKVFAGSQFAYVECKKKDPQTREETEIALICNEICVAILNEMKSSGLNYAITITFGRRIRNEDVVTVVQRAKEIISSRPQQASISAGNDFVISIVETLPLDVTTTTRAIKRPNLVNVQYFVESFEINTVRECVWSMDPLNINIDAPVRNHRSVAILSSFEPHRISTVLGSVRDAYRQISAVGGPGIIAVELSLNPRTAQWDLEQILRSTEDLLKEMPLVSLVVYIIEENYRIDEQEFVGLRSHALCTKNKYATKRVPEAIEMATIKASSPQRGSLLDD
jgi:hypothetical protein